jgi:4'-phosphopantetheinyl transferase
MNCGTMLFHTRSRLNQTDDPSAALWGAPPEVLPLPVDIVHVWRVLLDSAEADPISLSTEEQARANRLVHELHRNRFIAMKAVVRDVLSRYLETTPNSIEFEYGEKGKPAIAAAHNALGLRFNISHSGGIGLIAVAMGREVGVDVETRQEIPDAMSIAKRFFARREYQELSALPEAVRQRAFLRCWTRKEAYVKALGAGLSCPLHSFAVSVSPEVLEEALIEGRLSLSVADLVLPDECSASVAIVEGSLPRCCWTYGGGV